MDLIIFKYNRNKKDNGKSFIDFEAATRRKFKLYVYLLMTTCCEKEIRRSLRLMQILATCSYLLTADSTWKNSNTILVPTELQLLGYSDP